MISAHLEITGGIIRLYSAGSFEEASPFDMSMYLVGDHGKATLKGLVTEEMRHAHRIAIRRCLRAHDFSRVAWERAEWIDGRVVMRPVEFAL